VPTKTSAAVVDHILGRLFRGQLRSGDRIDHVELERALGVSRLPVREALVILERDGIVSTKYHRGVFVEPFDGQSILDDFEIMGLLSGLAVRRLAEHPDAETIATLRSLLGPAAGASRRHGARWS
jgi:DNA-binding GntR family transcriptional regulator